MTTPVFWENRSQSSSVEERTAVTVPLTPDTVTPTEVPDPGTEDSPTRWESHPLLLPHLWVGSPTALSEGFGDLETPRTV